MYGLFLKRKSHLVLGGGHSEEDRTHHQGLQGILFTKIPTTFATFTSSL